MSFDKLFECSLASFVVILESGVLGGIFYERNNLCKKQTNEFSLEAFSRRREERQTYIFIASIEVDGRINFLKGVAKIVNHDS